MIGLGALAGVLCLASAAIAGSKRDQNPDRPQLPYNMMGVNRDALDAYDSKGEPVAAVTAALMSLNNTGWELIHRYYPTLGTDLRGAEKKVHPEDDLSSRVFTTHLNEDPTFSPIPLLSLVWSLPEVQLTGRLKALHDDVAAAMTLDDYSSWPLEQLRNSVHDMTTQTRTARGVKYRTPKSNLSFKQSLRLYAMTVNLIRRETKWADKTDSPAPDMVDFTNRLSHQMPVKIKDGQTAAFLLYRPGVINNPLSKQEMEERADVVVITRARMTAEAQQFPAYLTANQKEWNPSWIDANDEANDPSLNARKVEHDWTRLDGPYLWFRPDQLDGQVLYQATAKFQADQIIIEGERVIESRGMVKWAHRPRDYDPLQMTAFVPGKDEAAGAGWSELMVEAPRLDDQMVSWKRPMPYFSNGFRAWCAYGRWTSGLAPDGKTWIAVPPDEPRPGAAECLSSSCSGRIRQ